MRFFFRGFGQTLKNMRDPQKRKIYYLKTVQLRNWVSTRRILLPIFAANLIGVFCYMYSSNEVFSLKVSLTRKVSKITGKITNLYLPLFMRKRIFLAFSNVYGVNLDEIKEDLESFSTFNEFFTREIKPRKINPEDSNEIISPADSKILSITEITENQTILVKGKKYKLGHFLTGIKEYEIKGEIIESMKKKSQKNKIYQVIFYLNPGDYHRFHSPTDFYIKKRLHLVGYLYPVKESYVETHDEVFETNERIAVFGESPKFGFISMVFVGALNVGSISLNFDPDLKTNAVLQANFQRNAFRDFAKKKGNDMYLKGRDIEEFLTEEIYETKDGQKGPFIHGEQGVFSGKGCELGRFNMGSTVVLFFEADDGFKFEVKAGQKVKFGDVVGRFVKKEEING